MLGTVVSAQAGTHDHRKRDHSTKFVVMGSRIGGNDPSRYHHRPMLVRMCSRLASWNGFCRVGRSR